MFNNMYIYKTTNTINNKIYIGISSKNSIKSLSYLGSGITLKKALKKYGRENFKKEIIEENEGFEYKDLQELEKFYISLYNSTNNNIGYNISQGGDGNFGEANGMFGKNHSEESILKMTEIRNSKIKLDPTYGKMSEENILKAKKFMSERNRVSPTLPNGHSDDTKKRISETVTAKILSGEIKRESIPFTDKKKEQWSKMFSGDKNPFYGKTHSIESVKKMRQAIIEKQPPCIKMDKEGVIIKRYDHLSNVVEDGYRPDLVKLVHKGVNKSHKGFLWKIL
jgi:group I intron endonuclease